MNIEHTFLSTSLSRNHSDKSQGTDHQKKGWHQALIRCKICRLQAHQNKSNKGPSMEHTHLLHQSTSLGKIQYICFKANLAVYSFDYSQCSFLLYQSSSSNLSSISCKNSLQLCSIQLHIDLHIFMNSIILRGSFRRNLNIFKHRHFSFHRYTQSNSHRICDIDLSDHRFQ